MTPPPDHHLDDLFVRYWDDALTEAEGEELARRLAADPVARERFQHHCLQAVVAADLAIVTGATSSQTPASPRRWSRRRVLRYLAGGAAAGVLAGYLGWREWSGPAPFIRLTANGTVFLRTADGVLEARSGFLAPGATVSTHGPGSSAVLSYPDGTHISCTGDSAISVAGDGHRLVLQRGTATATVPSRSSDTAPLTLSTTEATLYELSGVEMTLGRARQATEVVVQQGSVRVAAPTGESLGVVRRGEILTVGPDGRRRKQSMPRTPDEFAWDLTKPLPDGWHVGHREVRPEGPVVVPEFWFDPYHQAEMSQIRSDHQWARGFVRLFPESVVRVRYWVDRPGPSQLVMCVRTRRVAEPATGVVECNDAFARARPRQWQWLEVKAGDMLDTPHPPEFGAPWVAFLIIFNTYKVDLGLRIADFRVTRPGRPAAL